jgi:hypothetical protein
MKLTDLLWLYNAIEDSARLDGYDGSAEHVAHVARVLLDECTDDPAAAVATAKALRRFLTVLSVYEVSTYAGRPHEAIPPADLARCDIDYADGGRTAPSLVAWIYPPAHRRGHSSGPSGRPISVRTGDYTPIVSRGDKVRPSRPL